MITKKLFGVLRDGTRVCVYRLTNRKGEYVEILDYGAAVQSLCVEDRSGNPGDVVLGVPYAEALQDFNLEGVIMGRCAGRIANARFELGGKTFQLEAGRGGHCLHSGSGNWGQRMFEACPSEENNSILLMLTDDGRGGFEVPAEIMVRYKFTDDSVLHLEFRVIPGGDTLIAPTSHMYFNLGGADIRNHLLRVNAESAVPLKEGIPTGEILPVSEMNLDFRQDARLGDRMPEGRMLDDVFLPEGEDFRKVAALTCPESGRRLTVWTDMPALTVFTFGAERLIPGKNGEDYQGFRSICLETGYVPDAIHYPQFPSPMVRDGELFSSHTAYVFSVAKE